MSKKLSKHQEYVVRRMREEGGHLTASWCGVDYHGKHFMSVSWPTVTALERKGVIEKVKVEQRGSELLRTYRLTKEYAS